MKEIPQPTPEQEQAVKRHNAERSAMVKEVLENSKLKEKLKKEGKVKTKK